MKPKKGKPELRLAACDGKSLERGTILVPKNLTSFLQQGVDPMVFTTINDFDDQSNGVFFATLGRKFPTLRFMLPNIECPNLIMAFRYCCHPNNALRLSRTLRELGYPVMLVHMTPSSVPEQTARMFAPNRMRIRA